MLTQTPHRLINVVWRPQIGPQKALVDCPYREIFFGGARGGGKTDGVLGKWALKAQRYGDKFNAVMFRRTTVSSEDAIERSRQIFKPLGAEFNGSKNIWRMPGGGRVSFAYLDKVQDADEYQGRNVTDAWVEEAGQYPMPDPILRLFGVLRSAQGIPTQLIVTANPGGAGQHWMRDRYELHPFPKKPKVLKRKVTDELTHEVAVIPSRITDNRILLDNDPAYITNLHMVGSKELVRAWLEGDWSAVEGAFFDGWSEKRHVVQPFSVPKDWMRFRSMDWGFARPSSIGWWAIASDDYPVGDGRVLPRGCMVRYRELYTAIKPDVGMRLDVEQLGALLKSKEQAGEQISYTVVDPAMNSENGGPSMTQRLAKVGVPCRPGDNTRIGKNGAMGGWDQFRSRLRGEANDRPMMAVFSTCKDFIRTVPVLQHDPDRPEDVDTESEDHVADEVRYACMSRPWVRAVKDAPAKKPNDYKRMNTDQGSWRA
jgi:hypothetical protein